MKNWLVRWVLGGIFRDIAEGKKGEALKKAYWWLSGRKRTWSALAGLGFAGLVAWKPELAEDLAPTITFVLGVMVTIGIADADWKVTPPPVSWGPIFQKIMATGPAFAAIVAFAVEFLPQAPGCGDWCVTLAGRIQAIAAVVAGITTWLAARFALPPAFPLRRAGDLK